jgi:hypothetical protein
MVVVMADFPPTDKKLLIELTVILALKLLLLFIIWHHFFSAAPDSLDADAMADVLLSDIQQGDPP